MASFSFTGYTNDLPLRERKKRYSNKKGIHASSSSFAATFATAQSYVMSTVQKYRFPNSSVPGTSNCNIEIGVDDGERAGEVEYAFLQKAEGEEG